MEWLTPVSGGASFNEPRDEGFLFSSDFVFFFALSLEDVEGDRSLVNQLVVRYKSFQWNEQ